MQYKFQKNNLKQKQIEFKNRLEKTYNSNVYK